MSWIKIFSWALWFFVHVCKSVSPEKYGNCEYTFQVWKPDENAVRRISDVEQRCSDVTAYVEREMGRTKENVAKEMTATRNATSYMEKALLQSKLDHAQLRLEVKDVSLQLAQVRTLQERINNRLELPADMHRGIKVRHTGFG